MILFDREFLNNSSNIHVEVPRGGLSLRKVDRDVYLFATGKSGHKTYSTVSLLKDCCGNCRFFFMLARPWAYTKIDASHSEDIPIMFTFRLRTSRRYLYLVSP